MIEENKRVLLGMSGGTDSSVAAMRLLEAGYEVTGVTFRFYELNDSTEYLEAEPALPCNFRHTAGGIRQQFNAFGNAVLGQVGHGSLIQVALEDGTAAAAADKSGGCDIL